MNNNATMIVDTALNNPEWEHIGWGTVKLVGLRHKTKAMLRQEVKEMVVSLGVSDPGFLADNEADIDEAVQELLDS